MMVIVALMLMQSTGLRDNCVESNEGLASRLHH